MATEEDLRQKEIREGMAERWWLKLRDFWPASFWNLSYAELSLVAQDEMRAYADVDLLALHSQGVVIKVEREYPFWCRGCEGRIEWDEAGYVAVEPLIEK